MATAIELVHVSHEHPLVLIEDFDSSSIAAPLVCCVCDIPIIGTSPAYACSQENSPCLFFLHKRCAESPVSIKNLHIHRLTLTNNQPHELDRFVRWTRDKFYIFCAACTREINLNMWVYSCAFCKINWMEKSSRTSYPYVLCARCVVMESVLDHEGHEHHSLSLLHRRACFSCDACGIEAAESSSYICHTCHFWIHSSCAAYPRTIKLRIHEDDTLQLIYSIPDMYRRFIRHCPICRQGLNTESWAYHCEESGYFVHIKCAAALLASGKNVIEIEDDDEHTYSDLMQFPLPSTDSLTENLIAVHESGNLTHSNTMQDEVDKGKESLLIDTIEDEVDNGEESPLIDHWSHPQHKLFLLQGLKNVDNSDIDDDDDDDDDDDNDEADDDTDNHIDHIDEMLVCDGCIQPISTASNIHYYGCIGCNFFLHTTCANHLPLQSHPGKCTHDPQHTLKLDEYTRPFKNVTCKGCGARTNGFTYKCNTCRDSIDICLCCCLAPRRIKHEYHKHPLVQRYATSEKTCNACLEIICSRFEYGCEHCSDIQIHQSCAMSFPKTISHRWDSHSISLIYPPIYYKGLRYCEICELEVNQEAWLHSTSS